MFRSFQSRPFFCYFFRIIFCWIFRRFIVLFGWRVQWLQSQCLDVHILGSCWHTSACRSNSTTLHVSSECSRTGRRSQHVVRSHIPLIHRHVDHIISCVRDHIRNGDHQALDTSPPCFHAFRGHHASNECALADAHELRISQVCLCSQVARF